MIRSATYSSWHAMRQRCTNPRHRAYPRYGGRGIVVCERWRSFKNFLADMGERPPGRTLDRRDNDGPYAPWNCRWATAKEQNRNSSHCKVTDEVLARAIALREEGWTMRAIAEELGIDHSHASRITRGAAAPQRCRNGHAMTPGNTYVFQRAGRSMKSRICLTCKREAWARFKGLKPGARAA